MKLAKPITLVLAGCLLAAGFAGLTAYADKGKKEKESSVSVSTYGSSAYREVTLYGASPSNTPAQNKQALQDAIAAIDAEGGGVIVVPYNIEYGYKRNTVSTHPDFSAASTDILVIDYSKGSTYATSTNPLSRDGMQVRYFSGTGGNESDGQHDGNTTWLMGNHHPALALMHNNATSNNRQATVFFGNRGKVNWGIGQGTNAIAGGTDDQLSHFKIVGNNINGGTGLTTMFTILKTNGYFGFNNNAPTKEFTFAGRQADTEFLIQQTKTGGDVYLILRTKTNERKFKLEDDNGDLVITRANSAAEAVRLSATGTGSFANGVAGGAFASPDRPDPATLPVGTMIFDSTLGKPLWSHDGQWKDANGTAQ